MNDRLIFLFDPDGCSGAEVRWRGNRFYSNSPSSKSPSRRRQRDAEVLASTDRIEPEDDIAWAERAQYWESLGAEASAEPEPFNAPVSNNRPWY